MFEKAVSNCVLAKVSMDEITEAEKRMGIQFPESLRKFYQEYGYGFVNNKWHSINKLLAPKTCADFRLREDVYKYDYFYEDEWDNTNAEKWSLIFFEYYPQEHLSIGLEDGKIYTIIPEVTPIADSLEEFLEKIVVPEYWLDPKYRQYAKYDENENYDEDDEDYDDEDYDDDDEEE